MAELDIILRLDIRGRFEKGDASVGEADGFEDIDIEGAWVVEYVKEYPVFAGVPRYREVKTAILQHMPVELRNTILEALDQTILQETLRENLD